MAARSVRTIALGIVATIAAAAVAAPMPQPIAPAATWFTVGAVRVASLRDGEFLIPNDGKTFGVDVGPAKVAALLTAAGRSGDTIPVSDNSLLVMLPGRMVLIDAGLGTAPDNKLNASLAAAGVTPDQVTDILITHSHGDHIGGLVDAAGAPAFPRAKIRLSAAEWAFLRGNAGAATLVAAITQQVATFAPGSEVVPGITAVDIPGHTPGHVGYEIASGSSRLLDIGDAAHSTIVSLQRPDWIMGFDSDAAVGRASRRAELARLAASHERVFAPHFPFPGVGTVAAKGDGYAWVPAR